MGAITASHVNSQSPRTHDALSLKKHMESGRVSATHVLVEKIRNPGAVGRVSFEFTITLNARRI